MIKPVIVVATVVGIGRSNITALLIGLTLVSGRIIIHSVMHIMSKIVGGRRILALSHSNLMTRGCIICRRKVSGLL